MACWTNWRHVAEHGVWYSDVLDWDGPACYELAVAGPHGGNLRIVYVGETISERKRVAAYARSGSHLSKIIAAHLRDGWHLWYRARAARSKAHAVEMQDSLLLQYDYDWNLKLNS
jgi:hypothetical protein